MNLTEEHFKTIKRKLDERMLHYEEVMAKHFPQDSIKITRPNTYIAPKIEGD